jgi:hypothetical protein
VATCRGAKPAKVPNDEDGVPRAAFCGLKEVEGGGRAGRDGCGEDVLDGRPGGGG